MENLPQLVILGFILLFGLTVFLLIRTSRKAQAEKNQQIGVLGFQAPTSPPAGLQSRVEALYRTGEAQELVLQGVYHRRDLEGDLYLFDLFNAGGDGTELGQEIFGLVSDQLALPRFSLTTLPDFNRDSLLGGLMDALLDSVMTLAEKHLGMVQVEFPDRPDLADRLVAFGRDPHAVRQLLERLPLGLLRDYKLPIQISGSGDFLAVDFSISGTSGAEGEDLLSQYQHFQEILRAFIK